MDRKILSSAIIGGVVITLLTGLIPQKMLLGATHYGYPFAWLIRLVIAPQYFPWRVDGLNLIGDIVIWGIIIGIIVFAIVKFKK